MTTPADVPDAVTLAVTELVGTIGKCGARSVEFGFLPDDLDKESGPAKWWAKIERAPRDYVMSEVPATSGTMADHIAACSQALFKAWGKLVARSGRTEIQVHTWRWPSRRDAVRSSRRMLAEVGVTRELVVHNGTGQGIPHTDRTCWCAPSVFPP